MNKSLAAVAASLLLVGCSSGAPTNAPATTSSTTSTTTQAAPATSAATAAPATPAATAPAAPATSVAQGDSMTKAFGSTFTWPNGVQFTLSAPKPFTPSSGITSMVQNKALNEYVIMDATLVNNTKEPVSPMMINTQATTGDAEAEAIFDTAKGVSLPTADILPGKTSKYKVAFARAKGQEFVVSVSNMTDFTSQKGYYK